MFPQAIAIELNSGVLARSRSNKHRIGSSVATSSGHDLRIEAGFRMPAMQASSSARFVSALDVASVPLALCRFTGPPAAGCASLRAVAGEITLDKADK